MTETGGPAVRVLCIGGSTRPASSSERALREAGAAAERLGARVRLITGPDLVLPMYQADAAGGCRKAGQLIAAIRECDALIISSPGYHGAISGLIKNALDYVEELRDDARPYLDGVPVGCVAVAQGWQAAVSTLASLRSVVHALRGWPSPLGAAVNSSPAAFAAGELLDESARWQLATVAAQVVDFASRPARPASEPAPACGRRYINSRE